MSHNYQQKSNTTMLHILTFVAIVCHSLAQESKLIFVQEVFRHGARYPIYPTSLDGSDFSNKEHSAGELTSQGKAMHYMLGKMLYKDYWSKLFGSNMRYNQSKFYFKSSDVNRTIDSVQSQLNGLFQNIESVNISQADLKWSLPAWNYTLNRQAGYVFDKSPPFHPMPIHVEKGQMSPWNNGDFLRAYAAQNCYRQNDWVQSNKQDPYVKQIISNQNFTNAISQFNQALGTNFGFFDLYRILDNAECMRHMNKDILPILKQEGELKRAFDAIKTLEGYIKYFYNENQLRATATGFFNQTVNNFKQVTKDKSGVQWIFYSAHDTTVMNFIARMGLTSVKCIYDNFLNGTVLNNQTEYCIVEYPTYTSSLIFQIYEGQNNLHTFKVRYNGNYRRIPFCDWNYECEVKELYKWYESWKDQDFVKSCGIKDSKAETLFSIVIIELAVVIILVVVLLKGYLDRKQNKDDKKVVKFQNKQKEQQAQETIRRKSKDYAQPVLESNKLVKDSLLSEDDS